jgi:hypothetical protein
VDPTKNNEEIDKTNVKNIGEPYFQRVNIEKKLILDLY